MSFLVFGILCATTFAFTGAASIDISGPSCNKEADNYGSCLRDALEGSWPTIIKGMPELDLPSLDPYFTEYSETTYQNGEVRGKVVVKNANTYGFAKAKFIEIRPHFQQDNKFRLEIDVEVPKIFIDGDYKAEGSLGSFKMGGKGYFNISMEDVAFTWDVQGAVEDDTWTIEHVAVAPTVGKMRVWFQDLFNGNEELNKAALYFVNEYWSVLYKGMLPYVSQEWDKEVTQFLNRVFSRVSFKQLFS